MSCFFCKSESNLRHIEPPLGTDLKHKLLACNNCRQLKEKFEAGEIEKEQAVAELEALVADD